VLPTQYPFISPAIRLDWKIQDLGLVLMASIHRSYSPSSKAPSGPSRSSAGDTTTEPPHSPAPPQVLDYVAGGIRPIIGKYLRSQDLRILGGIRN
jgi:hypothetical protein